MSIVIDLDKDEYSIITESLSAYLAICILERRANKEFKDAQDFWIMEEESTIKLINRIESEKDSK